MALKKYIWPLYCHLFLAAGKHRSIDLNKTTTLTLFPFISPNTTIYFFVKKYFFFEFLYFSEYNIQMLLFVYWFRKRPSIKYVRNWENGGGHPKCVQVRTVGEGYHASCAGTYTHLLFSQSYDVLTHALSCGVLFYLQKFNLIFIQKERFCQKLLFFSNEINFCCRKISFFTLSCFSESKLVKTLLILIKQNLRFTLYFSVIPYFENILCSVLRRFI